MTQPLHARLRFDTESGAVFDATRRYVLVRADVLTGLFDELGEPAKSDALRAFGRSVARPGADSVRAYIAASGTDALAQTMERAAASLGWGRWQLEGSGDPDDAVPSLRLAVENSPFVAAAAPSAGPVCHAIAGMLEAIAAALWKRPAIAHETRCRAQHGDGLCRFVAMPAGVAMPPSSFPSQSP
jgi:predicted hydrocarbon binding protein